MGKFAASYNSQNQIHVETFMPKTIPSMKPMDWAITLHIDPTIAYVEFRHFILVGLSIS